MSRMRASASGCSPEHEPPDASASRPRSAIASLTPKQQRFIEEYLVDLNATQAAIRAGYSARSAASIGEENLRKPDIAAAVEAAQQKRAERLGVTADRIEEELAAVAFSNLRDVASWDEDEVTLIPADDLSDQAARSLREVNARVETVEGESGSRTTRHVQVKQHDKLRALELLGKRHGMWRERVELHHSGLADVFAEIRRRAMSVEQHEEPENGDGGQE